MPRNFHKRFELLFLLLDKEARKQVLNVLKRPVRDDRNRFLLTPSGKVRRWGVSTTPSASGTLPGKLGRGNVWPQTLCATPFGYRMLSCASPRWSSASL
ncbi:hypothetical protein [Thermus caliditerrae]|uniref:hypothetical protein n=1 Tax=Thermus caliditerrae TaxID=1330700 RepID=UPI001F3E8940|nr:hypothetical protein [Thermus caliditerrae]